MGNQCCAQRSSHLPDAESDATPLHANGTVTQRDESKFRTQLKEKFKFHRVDFSTFSGQTEAAILVENDFTNHSRPKLVQRFSFGQGSFMEARRMEQQLDQLKEVKERGGVSGKKAGSEIIYNDYFRRENNIYYVSAEFLGQGTRDLYMLGNIKGALSEQEIGQIAQQLLTQIKVMHDNQIYLYMLTPQSVLVKDGFKRDAEIHVQLANVPAMLVQQVRSQGSFSQVSGVDRIFLAPELNQYQMGPKCDVWSVGVILYLLVTGGVTDKRHEEFQDFKEPVWFACSEELKEFMMMAVCHEPRQRASVEQLLQTDFIRRACGQGRELDSTPLAETNLSDQGGNMYKFYMAHCINEMVCRYRLNMDKTQKIYQLKEQLVDAKNFFVETHSAITQSTLIELSDFQRALESKFGEFEASRIASFFVLNDTHQFTFEEAQVGVNQLFDEDLDEIVAQCFDKLDITDEATLTVKYIRQGLLVNSRTHVLPILKAHNKALLKYVYDMKSTRTFDKAEFGQYVRQCLEQDKGGSQTSRSNFSQYQQAMQSSVGKLKEESSSGQRRQTGGRSSGDSGKRQSVRNIAKSKSNFV